MFGILVSRVARLAGKALPHVSHSLISIIAEGVLEAEAEGGKGETKATKALMWTMQTMERITGQDLVDDAEFKDAVADVQRAIVRLYRAINTHETQGQSDS